MQTAYLIIFCLTLVSCQKQQDNDFLIAFGSCNNQRVDNPFWHQIIAQQPDVWVWGGDIIYSDTDNPKMLKENYTVLKNKPDYKAFTEAVEVIGTWDDHDYGVNDGGRNYAIKAQSQQAFLDFFEVKTNDKRRQQEGVYHADNFTVGKHRVKIIALDTRYFRSDLIPDSTGVKRYLKTQDSTATILGNTQWQWLADQLRHSKADFNIIMSSIQVFSTEHGFETWGNMPLELQKLEDLISSSGANNVMIVSGDRHISEFSIKNLASMSYPLIDFTSSGMTHSYINFREEYNPNRYGKVISQKSYGIIRLDFNTATATFEMWGENDALLQQHEIVYPH